MTSTEPRQQAGETR